MGGDGVVDAAVDAAADSGWTVAFEDGFEGDGDAGWRPALDGTSDDGKRDAGLAGEVFLGPGGRGSARALHAVRVGYDSGYVKSVRWERPLDTTASLVELSFSIFVPGDADDPRQNGRTQLANLSVPGIFFYPSLSAGKFGFTFESDGGYEHRPSKVSFAFDAWHTMTLAIDRRAGRVVATLDGEEALSDVALPGSTGVYRIAIGLRTELNATDLRVRYDDIVVRYR